MIENSTWKKAVLQQKYHALTGGYHGVELAITAYALLKTHTDEEPLMYLLHRLDDCFAHFDIDYISLKYKSKHLYTRQDIISRFSAIIDIFVEKPDARLDAIFAYEKKLLISRFIKPNKNSLIFYYNSIVKESVENNIKETLEEYFKKINISPEFSIIIDEKNNHNVRYKVTIRN